MSKSKKNKRADKAYLKAVEEIEKDRINEVKVIVKQVLEGIVAAQKQEKEAKEKLSLLKQDLADIRAGKIEKIKARHAKAKEENKSVPFDAEKLKEIYYKAQFSGPYKPGFPNYTTSASNTIGLAATSGTFSLNDGTVVNMIDAGNAK